MRNYTLSATASCIPYFKELREIAGSVTASILMQQLDYWFSKINGGPFYKFKAPCEHQYYKQGDSFTEELGFSIEEFTNAFLKIGTIYKSKTEFESSQDKFQDKFYCCYFDRKQSLTFYFRNHALLDKTLNELFTTNKQTQSLETDKVHLQKQTNPIHPIYISEDYNKRLQQNINIVHSQNERKSSSFENEFEEFWELYPRKEGKGGARTKFISLIKKAKDPNIFFQQLIEGLKLYNNKILNENIDKKFIAMPQTWLNQERWLDNHNAIDTIKTQTLEKNYNHEHLFKQAKKLADLCWDCVLFCESTHIDIWVADTYKKVQEMFIEIPFFQEKEPFFVNGNSQDEIIFLRDGKCIHKYIPEEKRIIIKKMCDYSRLKTREQIEAVQDDIIKTFFNN